MNERETQIEDFEMLRAMTMAERQADRLVREGFLRTPNLIEAFCTVERSDFLPPRLYEGTLMDRPLPIGFGQTNSQPSTVAQMLEWLGPKRGERVLDVGSGSGWTTTLLAAAVGPEGHVQGTERVPELVRFGRGNLAKYRFTNARISLASHRFGRPSHPVYDRILVSAGATELPLELVPQVRVGGKIVVPVEGNILEITKHRGRRITTQPHPGFVFVPLRSGKVDGYSPEDDEMRRAGSIY